MKYTAAIFIFSLFLFSSCSSEDVTDCRTSMDCSGDCLFEKYQQEGIIHFYNCYDTWGIHFVDANADPGEIIALIPDLETAFEVEDKAVIFSGTFFENDIPLSFPDPMPGAFYRTILCEIE